MHQKEYMAKVIDYIEANLNQPLSLQHIPVKESYSYAKISVKNRSNEINEAWDYLYLRWLKASMFEQARKLYFEEYIHKEGKIKKLILYLPVIKSKDYARITMRDCEDMFFLVSRGEGVNGEETSSKNVLDYIAKNNPFYIKKIRS